jgi:hypothetical protein
MTNLILTPVYKAYDMVKKCCDAIDQYTVNSYLHVLIDDDSDLTEPFPVGVSEKRRILFIKRDYNHIIHKNGAGQAMQLGYDWANQVYVNEKPNDLPYNHVFLVESDVIVREEWDKKMLDIASTLPSDWLTLDVQSVNFQGKLVHPMTNTPVVEFIGDTLEVTSYPDFQTTLFNNKIFEAGIQFSGINSPIDVTFGGVTTDLLGGRHFRTKLVSAYHCISKSTRYLTVQDSPYRSPMVIIEIMKDVIKDKVVCDLGCGAGDLMIGMEKYAKEVIGMEKDGLTIHEVGKRGLNITEGDVLKDPIPKADVYYFWIEKSLIPLVLPRIKKGVLILGADPAIAEDVTIDSLNLKGEWREINYNEGNGLRQKGIFKLFIMKI